MLGSLPHEPARGSSEGTRHWFQGRGSRYTWGLNPANHCCASGEGKPRRWQEHSMQVPTSVGARCGRGATLVIVDSIDETVERCKAGDRAAFTRLFRDHRVDVARLIQRMLGPGADVEDLVQEVFLQVHRSIGAFRGTSRFSTWLYRVTVNVVLMHRRSLRSRPSFAQQVEDFEVVDAAPLPDEQAVRQARIRAFYRLLERLSEKKRTVFLLHEVEGLSPAEIGALVGTPVLTVRTRLFYARREVVQYLNDEPELRGLVTQSVSRGLGAQSQEEPA